VKKFDCIIVGAGFSGLYQLHCLRDKLKLNTLVIEEGDDLGGTWYWNRYPGARCDSESFTYGFTFSKKIFKNWTWKERYPKQNVILKYLKYFSKELNLKKNIVFKQKVISAQYFEKENLWKIKTNNKKIYFTKYLICAVGSLSSINLPTIKGINQFQGQLHHSGRWPKKKINLNNKVVGQVGTGSTGIQIAPEIAKQAKKLIIFQRSPNFSIPARNKKLSNANIKSYKKNFNKLRNFLKRTPGGHPFEFPKKSAFDFNEVKRNLMYEKSWQYGTLSFRATFNDIVKSIKANKTAVKFIENKIYSTVKNREYAKILTNFDHPFTAKRPTLNTNYYEMFNKKNVELVDLKASPIIKITKKGIKTKKNEYILDKIIFATGFDALTGSIEKLNIIGKKGIKLSKYWKSGPKSFLGLLVPNFPNLFIVSGPGSPSVLTNVPVQIEQHVEWITKCIKFLENNKRQSIESTNEAANKWQKEIMNSVKKTLFLKAKSSWYKGDNIPGKSKSFLPYPGGMPKYRNACLKVEKTNYKELKII
jgi:cyclohexanone monooxygenase